VKPGELKLDGATLADIYMGKITKWNGPEIQKLNPSVKLPNLAIAPIYRADGSGTNFLFTNYLSSASPEFKDKIGANTSVQWPLGIGAKGNEGVAGLSGQTDGSIAYVEYAYAKQNKLTYVDMINSAGNPVEPSIASFQAAAANADWANAKNFYLVLTNQPGAASWPITGASFILVYKQPDDPTAVQSALKFFAWAYKDGTKMAQDLDYVPMPDSAIKLVEASWSQVKGANGAPVWTMSER
jgi:phosphate transport system substrate-binding protein